MQLKGLGSVDGEALGVQMGLMAPGLRRLPISLINRAWKGASAACAADVAHGAGLKPLPFVTHLLHFSKYSSCSSTVAIFPIGAASKMYTRLAGHHRRTM